MFPVTYRQHFERAERDRAAGMWKRERRIITPRGPASSRG